MKHSKIIISAATKLIASLEERIADKESYDQDDRAMFRGDRRSWVRIVRLIENGRDGAAQGEFDRMDTAAAEELAEFSQPAYDAIANA